MPPIEDYKRYLEQVYANGILTNQGPLVRELETKLKHFLQVNNFHYLTNGTVALQLALAALDIQDGEIITTPFSYVATTSSIMWERCKPVFVDIETDNFTIDATKIEALITEKTRAIMAVHVFGYPCDVEKIQSIADRYKLKVIYDAAHAFGSLYNGKSLLNYGDVATCSFHATKLFHTVEGGACIVKDSEISKKLELQKRFGHNYDEHVCLGINAKQSEFHAAMGLANFPYLEMIIKERERVSKIYDAALKDFVQLPKKHANLVYNYAYYPVIFKSEKELLQVVSALNNEHIYPRRYFYPSLNKLSYLSGEECPISENISKCIVCLPLYVGLEISDIEKIIKIVKDNLL